MREIKFRLRRCGKVVGYERWNNLIGKWCNADFIPHLDKDQYTGLHDKNGVEIYEGDNVVFLNEDGTEWTVRFNIGFQDGRFVLANLYPNKSLYQAMKDYCLDGEESGSNLEVIPEGDE